jgi:site-specific DNA-methyltransferase (adenine-specific)
MLQEIWNGDCLELMKNISDCSVNLTVTSPPYDNLRNYNNSLEWSENIWKNVISELYRVTISGGVVVWVVADSTVNGSESGSSFKQALYAKEIGFNIHDTMIYHKVNPTPVGGNNRYYQSFEYMFVFSKGVPKLNPIVIDRVNKWGDKRTTRFRAVSRDKNGGFLKKQVDVKEKVKKQNVWSYTVGGGISTKDKMAYGHPAIFPEQLVCDHIISWSNENDLVLDPMAGSGTVLKVAKKLNRQFIGIEKVKEYYDICLKRLCL